MTNDCQHEYKIRECGCVDRNFYAHSDRPRADLGWWACPHCAGSRAYSSTEKKWRPCEAHQPGPHFDEETELGSQKRRDQQDETVWDEGKIISPRPPDGPDCRE